MNKESIYLPREATIKKIRKLTEHETLFDFSLDDNLPLGHEPGQFVEVSIMGVGEAPISVSSPPWHHEMFELCVRAVGNVTNALHRLKVGDKIGIRGPYGRGFDKELLKGKDILFICGGLGAVPLRSLIHYTLEHKKDYGKLTVLYGCKETKELLFTDEIECFCKRDDIEYHLTVDKVSEGDCWDKNVGVITTLIPKVELDPEKTYAVACGPPIMYKFVIKSLKERGMQDDHIIVSLERRMKCGVGKCGHCQINGVYVCHDGPVFYYSEIKDLPEVMK